MTDEDEEENELDDETYNRITDLCDEGSDLVDDDKYDEAIEKYEQALALIPEPITDWEASTWVLTGLADAYFYKGDYANARQTLIDAMHCPDAIGNPYIHLRLGQSQYEVGNMDRARDELVRAYMGAGEDIFDDEDPKYLALVKESIKPEEGGGEQ